MTQMNTELILMKGLLHKLPTYYNKKIFNYLVPKVVTKKSSVHFIRCFNCFEKIHYLAVFQVPRSGGILIRCPNIKCRCFFCICPACFYTYRRIKRILTYKRVNNMNYIPVSVRKLAPFHFCKLLGSNMLSHNNRKCSVVLPLRPNITYEGIKHQIQENETRRPFLVYTHHHFLYDKNIDNNALSLSKKTFNKRLLLHYYEDLNVYFINFNKYTSKLEFWLCTKENKVLKTEQSPFTRRY